MPQLRPFPTLLALCVIVSLTSSVASGAAIKKATARKSAPTPPAKTPAWIELPRATAGKAYSEAFQVVVGPSTTTPLTFVPGSGVPTCLTVSSQGILSGKPNAACAGTYRFTVLVTGYNGVQSSGTFLLHIDSTSAAAPGAPNNDTSGESNADQNGGDGSGSVNIEVDDGSKKVTFAANLGAANKPTTSKPTPASKDPDCGLVITSVLADGATEVKGTVNQDVIGDDGQIAFCRSRSGEPRTCMVGDGETVDKLLFEPLSTGDGYFVGAKKGTFDAKLLVPLDYGDSLNAVLYSYAKKCQQKAFGVIAQANPPGGASDPSAAGPASGSKPTPAPATKPGAKQTPRPTGTGTAQDATPQTPADPPSQSQAAAPATSSADFPVSASVPVLALRQPESAKDASEGSKHSMHGRPESLFPISAPRSPIIPVEPGPDWGRVRATFVLGILLANDTSQLSSAHQFYDMLVEKYWHLPGCYRPRLGVGAGADESKQCLDDLDHFTQKNWLTRHSPGVNTYFETRLTAIPISSVPSTSATSNATANTGGTFLTTQKTARVGVGVDLPFLITRWDWRHHPNALFLAPLGKTGFDTLAGSESQTVVGPDGGTTTATYERLYNYYGFGGRLGHYTLSHSQNAAPEWQSFLDVVVGRFSNLQSYICEPVGRKPSTFTSLPNSQCANAYGGVATNYVDSLKRPYRLDFEGALKVPYIPILIGFNANLGQHAVTTGHIDPAYNTPDDLRFLFGTKFDVAAFVTKLGLPQLGK